MVSRLRPLFTPPNDGTQKESELDLRVALKKGARQTELRNPSGSGTSPTPQAICNDLATWEMIPFLYTAQNRRLVGDMARMAVEPHELNRLVSVLDHELGHEVAFAVECARIAANTSNKDAAITLDEVERSLQVPFSDAASTYVLTPFATALAQAAEEILRQTNLDAAQIDRVIYVGGSSLMSMVASAVQAQFPRAEHGFVEVITAVTTGLAPASADM